jgi:hypothetical protein
LAEVGVGSPGRDYQRVVLQLGEPAVWLHGADHPPVQVYVLDIGQQDPRIRLARTTCRYAGAISPGGKTPAATWYSSG